MTYAISGAAYHSAPDLQCHTWMKAANDERKAFWEALGPGLITGAADDDPSGIGTYTMAGAQFGGNFLWAA